MTDDLLLSLAALGATSSRLSEFRVGALERIRSVVPFDAAIFHAFSPRVPLSTAGLLGLDVATIAATMPNWDAAAVTLGRLRDLANAETVATDRRAFPLGTPARALFERELGRPFRARAVVVVHLVVREAVRAVVLLVRRNDPPFDEQEVATLRRLAPVLAVADATQAALDEAPSASVPVRLACSDQRLTQRQREIVEHVALGQTNEEIARALGVSSNTLRNHVARIFAKLGASNRAELVRLAVLTRA